MANIDHIAVQVSNLKESVEWYLRSFNADLIYCDETWAMLEFGNTKLALTIPSQHPPHVAIQVSNISDFPCDAEEIREHRDGSKYLYVKDPSGNVIEYIYYPPEENPAGYIHLP